MKYDLEQASLLYLGKLLSNESYYTEELEDTYINLKGAIEERNKLQQENKQLKILVESLKLGVTLNGEQEKLLDSILLGNGNYE